MVQVWATSLQENVFAGTTRLHVPGGCDCLLLATQSGRLYCLHSSCGTVVWRLDVGFGPISTAPALQQQWARGTIAAAAASTAAAPQQEWRGTTAAATAAAAAAAADAADATGAAGAAAAEPNRRAADMQRTEWAAAEPRVTIDKEIAVDLAVPAAIVSAMPKAIAHDASASGPAAGHAGAGCLVAVASNSGHISLFHLSAALAPRPCIAAAKALEHSPTSKMSDLTGQGQESEERLPGGSALWPREVVTLQAPGEVFSAPVFLEDRLVFGCRDDCLHGLQLQVLEGEGRESPNLPQGP